MIKYNDYEFPEYSNVSVHVRYVYDDAERVVVAHEYNIQVRATILPRYFADPGDATTELHMQDLRERLSQPQKELIVTDIGLGEDLHVNKPDGTSTTDVKFGPKPRVLTWTPIGHANAGEILWEVSVHLSPCPDYSPGYSGNRQGLKELCYRISFSINRSGFTTRTVAGYLAVAQTIDPASGFPPISADQYRGEFTVSRPENCYREQTWDLSLDKCRLDFAIVDKEIESPRPYPPGVVSIRGNNAVSSRRPWQVAHNEITIDMELAQNQPRTYAWHWFVQIVNSLLSPVASYIDGLPSSNYVAVFYEQLHINESLFSNHFTFALRWRWVGGLDELLSTNFMFQPIAGLTWADWTASMSELQKPRGLAQMKHTPQDDNLTTLCSQELPNVTSEPVTIIPPPDALPSLCNPMPEPSKSWLNFFSTMTEVFDHNTENHQTLGETVVNRTPFDPEDTAVRFTDFDASSYDQMYGTGTHKAYFVYQGAAMRVGYKINKPDKVTVGGKTLTPVGRQVFEQQHLGRIFCQDVYAAAWKILYEVTEPMPDDLIDETELG